MQYPDGPLKPPEGLEGWPDNSLDFWPKAAGEFLAAILGPPSEPGPPYVHTFTPPMPIGQDEDGNDIYPPPGPAYTLTEGP